MEGSQGSTAGRGNNLGKYRLIAELGHGGMAEVFLAVVTGPAGFNKLVVIKQIRPQLAEDPEFLGMFLDEARLAARLSHPHVVQTNEVGQEGERYFIAMEYLEGQPLNRIVHRLHKTGGLSPALHLKILSDALTGLHHAHELADYDGTPLEVVHRDVTPHNVFVSYDGQVKVVDFGIAKALNSSTETRSGVLKGKVSYMAPEQARGERVDRRADIFSVGVMMWEAATGKRLWKGIPDITILQRLLSGDVPTPHSIKPDVPEKLEAIILKAMAHQRDERYATAADLSAAIDAYLEEGGERPHMRDLAKAVTGAFEADRTRIKAIIDEQLRVRPQSSAGGDLPALAIIDPQSQVGSGRQSLPDAGSGPGPAITSGSGENGRGGSTSYTAPSALFATSASAPAAGARRSRGIVTAVALLGGGAIAIASWQLTKTSPPAPASSAEVSAASGASAAPVGAGAPGASATVEISVSANPAEAKIFLDDKALPGNPARAVMPKDGATHRVRIEAPGYATKVDNVTFERDRSMDIALLKEADKVRHPVGGGPLPPPPVTAAPADEMTRPAGKKPQRTLDTSNPYNQ
jgi:serine/threonine protein kinase